MRGGDGMRPKPMPTGKFKPAAMYGISRVQEGWDVALMHYSNHSRR